MARLFSTGFELNTLTPGFDTDTIDNGGSTLSIVSTGQRSGSYALQSVANGVNTNQYPITHSASTTTADLYIRVYIKKSGTPTARRRVIFMGGGGDVGQIRLQTNDKLQLFDSTGVQIGADSATLVDGVWYRLEL